MPFSAIEYENSSVNTCISAYAFVLTKITLCSDFGRRFGCFGPQKIHFFSNFGKNLKFSEKSENITEN
jgi:hypothetical protein